MDDLPRGLYETLLTRALARQLDAVRESGVPLKVEPVDPDAAPWPAAQLVRDLAARALRALPEDERRVRTVPLVNRMIAILREAAPDAFDAEDDLADSLERLLAVGGHAGPDGAASFPPLPHTPLTECALFTNAPNDPSLKSELELELGSCERADLLCAFVRWNGVRILRDAIQGFVDRGGELRVLTTTYMAATERRAIDALHAAGARVRVSYDTRTTRLHAKAWVFHRRSGFTTAFVGSSNLSFSALVHGLEWNVRLSRASNPELVDRIGATFETCWQDRGFEPYDPARDAERFDAAVNARGASSGIDFSLLDVRPYAFQQHILDRLAAEREVHGRGRCLVVMATGTGKTVVAALDYRSLARSGRPPRLLFVAHRREILEQSLRTFRAVLRDGAFGDLYVDGRRPDSWEHVFASVQSLARLDLASWPPEHFDVVIVDEFHHAAAPTYSRLLDHFRPRFLLGLTATPERADGGDVTRWFDGRIAVELRLWKALDQRLLCPFQYFGVHDDVDPSALEWRRGRYAPADLERVYTGDDIRVMKILESLRRIVADPRRMRALGFCVGVEHARFMARKFHDAGIPSAAVDGNSPAEERDGVLRALRERRVNVVFAVDLFNEGIDVPEIDTVLLLRPTESATVFLQQIGRGLRFASDKDCLTILDFIGQQRREFRFDLRLRGLLGGTRREVERAVEAGHPMLPAGCHFELDRVAQQIVLENLRRALPLRSAKRVQELRRLGDVPLAIFLRETGLEIEDLYGGTINGWTALRRAAGFPVPEGPQEKTVAAAIGRLLHVDDRERIDTWSRWLASPEPPEIAESDERARRLAHMLLFAIWTVNRRFGSLGEGLGEFWRHRALCAELREVLAVLEARIERVARPLRIPQPIPLSLHAWYARDEVLAAFGIGSASAPPQLREGPKWDAASGADILFVTLRKDPDDYSPSTLYRDFPISETLFHWESQVQTTTRSRTGQRYLNHERDGSHVILCVRETRKTPDGRTAPYLVLGTARYLSHERERPIAITWRLDEPMPPDLFQRARIAAG